MDFAVSQARPLEPARLLALTTVAGDAVDPVDPRDCLAPGAWSLALGSGAPAGAPLPRVARVESAQDGTTPSAFLLALDAPLAPGVPYAISLGSARSAFGQPTSSAPVALVGPAVAGIAGQRQGELAGDIALPVAADAGGDLALVDRLSALRARVLLLVSVRRGAFTHAPTYGRGVEPKRSYSVAQLGQEASAIRAELERDPDVRSASVRAQLIAAHVARFDIAVVPRFSPEPLRLSETIEAGGST